MTGELLTVRKRIRESSATRPRALWRVLVPLVVTFGGLAVLLVGVFVGAEAVGAGDHAGLQPLGNLLAGAFVAGVVFLSASYIDSRRVQDYGFDISRRWILDFVAGSLLGVLLVGLLFGVMHQLGWVTVVEIGSIGDGPFLPMMGLFLLGWAAVGFWEEALFRGIFITNAIEGFVSRGLSKRTAVIGAWVTSSLVFGAAHLIYFTIPEGVPVTAALVVWILMGGLFGAAYLLTGELGFPIGLHFSFNYAVNNLFFTLPMHREAGVPGMLKVEVTAPGIWHPVGGLSLVPLIVLGFVLTIGWVACR